MSNRYVASTAVVLCLAVAAPTAASAQGNNLFRIGQDGRIEPNNGAMNNRPCEVLGALRTDVPDRLGSAATEPADLAGLSPDECRDVIATALAPSGAPQEAQAEADQPADAAGATDPAEVAGSADAPAEAEPAAEAAAEAAAPTQQPAADTEGGSGVAEADRPAAEPEAVQPEATDAPEIVEAPEAPDAPGSSADAAPETVARDRSEEAPEAEAPRQRDVVEAPETVAPEQVAGKGAEPGAEPRGRAVGQQNAEADPAPAAPEPEPEVRQEDTAESAARANEVPEVSAAAEAAAEAAIETGETRADPEPVPEADVTREVVTEQSVRSSGEEFASALQPPAPEGGGESGGRSTLETLAIGTLGGLLIGNLLSQGDDVVAQSEDRVVVRRSDGDYYVVKDDNTLLRQPGSTVETQRFDDGSSVETIIREDGTRIVTVRAADGQTLRRTRILPNGQRVVLFDDTQGAAPVDISRLPQVEERSMSLADLEGDALRRAILADQASRIDRGFTLRQIREIRGVRNLVPVLNVEAVTFDSGSAVVRATEARELSELAEAMLAAIRENPSEVFLIEGHTDAVGGAAMNLALSDRRAESVALALTEYFGVPPENMVVQGFGESTLRIQTQAAERLNRRVTVRRITPLLDRA